jgi:glucose/arabinose dehydrogenase
MYPLNDGRILICEQTGSLRVLKDGKLLDTPMLTVKVDNNWERGLIGVTVDPQFPKLPYVYVCYVSDEGFPHHRISRFTVDGDVAIEGSEKILLKGDDQTKLGGHVPAGHQGGALHFGNDGKLYIGIGEQTAGLPAQKLDTFQGKILRINSDGAIPEDNPLISETTDKYQAIWAYGCRNPFTFAFQRSSGKLFINDVGGKYEEINLGVAGANYGWPKVDHGPTDTAGFHGPQHIYPEASISGGDFLESTSANEKWPSELTGKYFFADFVHGWIKWIDPEEPEQSNEFAFGLRRPVDIRFAADGSLYVLLRNAWVIDGKFEGGTGSLVSITPQQE